MGATSQTPSANHGDDGRKIRGIALGESITLCGLWYPLVWTTLLTFRNAELDQGLLSIDLSLGLALVIIALVSARRNANPSATVVLDGTAALLMCVPPLLSLIGAGGTATMLLGVVAGGIGLAWSYNRWGTTYLRLGTRETFKYVFVSFIVAAVIKSVLVWLPTRAQSIAMVMLAILCFVFVRMCDHLSLPPVTARRYKEIRMQDVVGLSVSVFAFAFVCNAVRVYLRTGFEGFSVGAGTLVATYVVEIAYFLLMYALVVWREYVFGFVRLWSAVLVSLVTSVLLSSSVEMLGASYLLSGVSVDLISAYFWLALVDIARHGKWDSATAFAAGWAGYAIAKLTGKVFCHFALGTTLPLPLPLFLLWVASLATIGCMGNRGSLTNRVFSDLEDVYYDPADFALIDERCSALAEAYGLSARETDVMRELCKGRSKQFVAEALSITENTVRGHTKRLYAKLGIHSREELQDMVGM